MLIIIIFKITFHVKGLILLAVIRPFKSVRPEKEYAHLIASLPYDVMNSDEALEMVKNNPLSFLHIDRAEINFEKGKNPYEKDVYEKASSILYKMISEGYFIQDNSPCLYIYRLTMNGRSQNGLVACTSVDDYINDVIKKHEHTRKDKEQDRINHVNFCNANTGPIFLTYKHNNRIKEIINDYMSNECIYNFISEDNISHEVWIIKEQAIINELVALFEKIDSLYIADGHHRAASAINVGLLRREENKNYTINDEFNYFLSVIFPDDELFIMDYNRVVLDLNGLSKEEFLEKISSSFIVEKTSDNKPYKPTQAHTFGMYLINQWYKISAKCQTYSSNDVVSNLDVSILQNYILEPILAIHDPRTDKRIDFIGGIRGLSELERRVNDGMKVAFSMCPTSIDELMQIADAKKVMPPKSTWFEPKLRSGLFIHLLK